MIVTALTTLCANAKTYKGSITIEVGETYSVDVSYGSYVTQSGSWSKSNSTFVFVSQGQRSCTIRGNQVGTGTLEYWGFVNADIVEYYWTVNVVPKSNNNDSDDNSDDDKTGISINSTNFPDENFRNYLLGQSEGKDGVLTESEIKRITYINVSNKNISSLKGIEYFTALTSLSCSNNQLTALDVSKNTALTKLYCSDNQLTALDVSKNTALTSLWCYNNQLTALDVSKNTALTDLWCYNNQLTALDVSKNTALTGLSCGNNQLTALDV